MSEMLMALFSASRAAHTLHLRLCTAAFIPQLVNDILQMKQCLIAVWSGLQQTVVNEAIDEQKSFYAFKWMRVREF